MAIVGDKTWEEIIIKADDLVLGEKYFDISQLDEAWEWVEGGSEWIPTTERHRKT